MITTCNYISGFKEHDCNYTDFVTYLESFFSNTFLHIHILTFIDYAMQQLIFADVAGHNGGIQLYCHVGVANKCLHSCMSNLTVPKQTSSNCAKAKEACRA